MQLVVAVIVGIAAGQIAVACGADFLTQVVVAGTVAGIVSVLLAE